MPELRKDPLSDSWVLFAPERKLRPQYGAFSGEDLLAPENCPFCEGNESLTPPEISAVRNKNSKANQPGWQVRVVPNKYPALKLEGRSERTREGFYDRITGIGAHEVVIETNSHFKGIDELEVETVATIFRTFKQRILDLKQDKRLRYVQVINNHGFRAGATILHPHSQVVGMPVVPARIKERLKHAIAHFDVKGSCIFCDIIHHEIDNRKRVLFETPDFIVISPYASRFPFEMVIYPRVHSASFEEAGDEEFHALAEVFKETIGRFNRILEHPAYNLLLHNAPFESDVKKHFHWHWELIPIISGIGAFELGTYTYINPTPPEEAIEVLRKI